MALIPEIDEQACRDNARRVLKSYRRLARMAGRPLADLKSPSIDGMPKAKSFENGVEASLVAKLDKVFDARDRMDIIDNALALCSFQSRWVLYFCYCTPEELALWQVAERLGVENAGVVKYQKKIALMEFAEAYPNNELMVFQNFTQHLL